MAPLVSWEEGLCAFSALQRHEFELQGLWILLSNILSVALTRAVLCDCSSLTLFADSHLKFFAELHIVQS